MCQIMVPTNERQTLSRSAFKVCSNSLSCSLLILLHSSKESFCKIFWWSTSWDGVSILRCLEWWHLIKKMSLCSCSVATTYSSLPTINANFYWFEWSYSQRLDKSISSVLKWCVGRCLYTNFITVTSIWRNVDDWSLRVWLQTTAGIFWYIFPITITFITLSIYKYI